MKGLLAVVGAVSAISAIVNCFLVASLLLTAFAFPELLPMATGTFGPMTPWQFVGLIIMVLMTVVLFAASARLQYARSKGLLVTAGAIMVAEIMWSVSRSFSVTTVSAGALFVITAVQLGLSIFVSAAAFKAAKG